MTRTSCIPLFFLLALFAPRLCAQSVGINTTSPDASAALDVTSTTQGILVPRLTTAQRTAVSGPATGLLVVGILCAVTAVLSLVSHLLGAGARNTQDIPPQFRQIVEMTTGNLGLVVNLLGLGISGLIIFASTKMRKLESRGLVLTATILSMLPCTSACCCVGLPVGIWILTVLVKPGVKSAFR